MKIYLKKWINFKLDTNIHSVNFMAWYQLKCNSLKMIKCLNMHALLLRPNKMSIDLSHAFLSIDKIKKFWVYPLVVYLKIWSTLNQWIYKEFTSWAHQLEFYLKQYYLMTSGPLSKVFIRISWFLSGFKMNYGLS